MGCSMLLRAGAGAPYIGSGEVPDLDYDDEGRVNRGSLCGKGNMALELLTHPSRLEKPRVRSPEGELVRASWEVAMEDLVRRLRAVTEAHGPGSVGFLLGPTLTNEEAAKAAQLARAIGTPHVDQSQPEDHVVLKGLSFCGAEPTPLTEVDQLERAKAILVVGDLFTLSPCMAKPVLQMRYDNRQNLVGTLGFWKSRTFLFGKPVLRCLAGREAAALTVMLHHCLESGHAKDVPWANEVRAFLKGLDIEKIERLAGLSPSDMDWFAGALEKGEETAVLFAAGFAATERLDLAAGLSALLAEVTGSRYLAMVGGANAYGLRTTLAEAGFPGTEGLRSAEMLAAAGTGEIKALFALGCDPVGAYPGGVFEEAAPKLELLAATAPLGSATMDAAHVVFPTGTWGEKTGTVVNSFGHENELVQVMPPPGTARTDADVLDLLLDAVGGQPAGTAPPEPMSVPAPAEAAAAFFAELELYLRFEDREDGAREMGTHWLFPEASPGQSADGWLTNPLSWPQHESPGPGIALSPAHARELGVKTGDRVRVRSRDAAAELVVRIEQRLVEDVVLVAPYYPETRRLTGWRLDGVLRDLDLRPERVSVEAVGEVAR